MPKNETTTDTDGQGSVAEQVRSIFDLWVDTHRRPKEGKAKGIPPRLDAKREAIIRKAIAMYDGPEAAEAAILGCKLSDFHQGNNPRRKKYDELELILRDAKHIEMFAKVLEEHQDDPDAALVDAARKEDEAW
jgi:hypothetical protein